MRNRIKTPLYSTRQITDEMPLAERKALLKARMNNRLRRCQPGKQVKYFFMFFGEKKYIQESEINEYQKRQITILTEEI